MPSLGPQPRRDPKLHWKSRRDGVPYAYAVFYDPARHPKRKWWPSGMTDASAAEEWFTDVKRAWRRGDFDPWRDGSIGGPRELAVSDAIEKYFRANTHLGKGTVSTRRSVLKALAEGLPAGVTLGYVEPRHVEHFLAQPNSRDDTRPLSVHTRYGYKGILSYFFSWCVRKGLRETDPTEAVKLPKRGRKLPEFLTPAEFVRLEQAAGALLIELQAKKRGRVRDRDVVWILDPVRFALATGLRLGDVCRLEWSRVRLDAGVVLVDDRTKTGHEYAVPILRLAREVLDRQREEQEEMGIADGLVFHGPYPVKGRWRPLSRNNLQHKLREVRDKAGLRDEISFHTLRHTFATWMLMQTGNIRLVSSMLGHTSVTQTETYAHVALLAARQIRPSEFESIGVAWEEYADGSAAGYGSALALGR